MMTEKAVWPDVAIPPGETLAETLEALGMSQADLGRRAGRPVQAINEIVQGKKEITPETALEFERVLGVPAHIWLGLEADYRMTKARLDEPDQLKTEVPLAKCFPYAAMAKLGWVRPVRGSVNQVRELLAFFRVSSLRNLEYDHVVAFRRSPRVRTSPEAILAWLRKGDIEAEQVETRPFDAEGLRELPTVVRGMTLEPNRFEPRLHRLLAERGVALVIVPNLPGVPVNGATRWIGGKAVLQLSLRYRWQDIFWFSLLHELGHLLLHGRRERFIDLVSDGRGPKEDEANRFAADHLIPPRAYATFLQGAVPLISQAAVEDFARDVGVAPGIVVGRLHYDQKLLPSHLNGLRGQFQLRGEEASEEDGS